MKKVVIAGYVRSPFAPAKKGELASVRADEMAAQVVAGLVKKTGIKVDDLEDLILGCAFPEGEQGFNLSRLVMIAHWLHFVLLATLGIVALSVVKTSGTLSASS